MAQVYTHSGERCQEHPHRPTDRRCDRCGRPFCDECLLPQARIADGTREWWCRACVLAADVATRRQEHARSIPARLARLSARTRAVVFAVVGLIVVVVLTGAAVLGGVAVFRPRGAVAQPEPLRTLRCGELSRIRSVAAIGTQAAEDAVNVLAYPERATARLVAVPAPAGAPSGATSAAAPEIDLGAVVDECDSGWHADRPLTLPAGITLDTRRTGSYVQRLAFWQDPAAPRSAWVREFDVLASPSADGDDFVPVALDRPAQLRETTEGQWFEVVRAGPGAQPFPDVVQMRRLLLRIRSTYGAPGADGAAGVSLGEVAAYGPDLEVVIAHPSGLGGEDTSRFLFAPAEIRALALQPKFVLFINRTPVHSHTLVSLGQSRNLEVTIPPGEARSVQFTAGRPGRYEFYCKVAGHDRSGLIGTIDVR